MNELTIISHDGIEAVDSREVAKMIDKRHDHLLRDIAGYIAAMKNRGEPKIRPVDFFIPSTYKDRTGRTLPCFLCTKKGCGMVANEMTGEKGVIFTATYVTAFEAMREEAEEQKRGA